MAKRNYIFEIKNFAKSGTALYGLGKDDFADFISALSEAFEKAGIDDKFPFRIEIPRGGDSINFLERGNIEFIVNFDKDGKQAIHDLFIIDNEDLKGKGLSKKLYGSLLPVYDKVGVEEIKIHAGDKNGGYTWTRYGFRVTQSEAEHVIGQIKDKDYKKEAQSIFDNFYRKHDDGVSFPLHLFGDKPWGREALSGTQWRGVLDLTDKQQRSRYERYIAGMLDKGAPKKIGAASAATAHATRLARYASRVQSVYDTLNDEIAKAVVRTGYDGTTPFRFADYPLTKKKFEEVQAAFVRDLRSLIYSGTSEEWKQSNLVQDLLADNALKFYGVKRNGKKARVYYQTNSDALKAFQRRKDDGLTLSAKLWNQSKEYKTEMEHAISSAIEKGTSAVKLSKRLSKYLEDYPSLKKDYKEKFGKAVTCQDCEYRSIRLARSEINMAYRTAEQERWKQFDFVLGYEVKTTQNGHHVPDICDDLAGKYPKDFVFKGWHPNCMCYVIPILKTEEQFWNDDDVSEIVEPPKNFTDWLEANAERIDKAAENGTLPYWYTDNEKYVNFRGKSSYDLLAMPEGLPSKYREKFDELISKAESQIDSKEQFRSFQVNIKRLAEMLADENARSIVEEQMGDYFFAYMEDYAKGKSIYMFEDQVRKFQEYSGFVRKPIAIRMPNMGILPCNSEEIARYLNSIESLEEFYIRYGYRSYDEFFESMGGIDNIEEKLLSIAKESRVYMCLDASTFERQILKGEGKFKNSLETGKGSFKTVGEERAVKERIMFGLSDADYDVMPKYGFLAGRETMDYEQIVSFGYGDTYVRFRDASVRGRTSITCGDSYDGNRLLKGRMGYSMSSPAVSLDQPDVNFSLGILSHSRDGEAAMKKLMSASKLSDIQTSTYVEAQIYGVLRIEDVDAVFVQSKKQMASLTKLLKKQGLDIEVLPCEYDTRLKYLVDGFTNYEGKASKYAHSLTDGDLDLLGDFYVDGLTKRFADPRNRWWKDIPMPDEFMESMQRIADGLATATEKRTWLKSYYAELRKKGNGLFPKVWWQEYSPSYGGWVSDVLNENLLKGL